MVSVARTWLSLHLRRRLIEQHFSEPQPLFSSEDFLQVDSVARMRLSLELRNLVIKQHSSLTRYSFCFQEIVSDF